MFKREMKINFKSFLIWFLVLAFMFLVVFLIYPLIIDSSNEQGLNAIIETFPEEMITLFNMDVSSLESVFGWFKTEGVIYIILVVGCYAGIMGSTILLKEENDKTIEYLNSLPIKRKDIVLTKVVSGLVYIVLMIFLVGIFNFIGLSLSGTFDKKLFLILSFTPLLPALVIYTICMFLATFFKKTKRMIGLSLGIVFISYIFQVLSSISENVSFLKYFSIFSLADTRNIIINASINPVLILISFVLIIIFIYFTLVRYNKKELI